MAALGFQNSTEAYDALSRVYDELGERCIEEQREAASSSERMKITARYDPLLTAVARTLDFLRRLPDVPPRPVQPYQPREAIEEEEDESEEAEQQRREVEEADAKEKAQLDKLDAIKNGDF